MLQQQYDNKKILESLNLLVLLVYNVNSVLNLLEFSFPQPLTMHFSKEEFSAKVRDGGKAVGWTFSFDSFRSKGVFNFRIIISFSTMPLGLYSKGAGGQMNSSISISWPPKSSLGQVIYFICKQIPVKTKTEFLHLSHVLLWNISLKDPLRLW